VPWDLRPVGIDFLDTAPYRHVATEVVHRPPEAIFAAIATDPAGWGTWFPGFNRAGRYLSDPPHGVGSVREVSMARIRYTETIIAWDEPDRWAFRVTRSTAPLAHAMAEEYRVSSHGHHSVVQWTFAIDPRPTLARATSLADVILPRMFRRAMTNLSVRLAEAAGPNPA